MRTSFTVEDMKDYIEHLFNGNLSAYKTSKGNIPYDNPNSEEIDLVDIDNGVTTKTDLAQYLNVSFYSWKQRLESKDISGYNSDYANYFEDWVASMNLSMEESYALVEKIDEEVVASQDIDSATLTGKITFLVQANKIVNLDYYVTKIRNMYLGNAQTIQNSYGDKIKAFIMLGALIYEQEPIMTQLGECVIVSCNFRISYLTDALTYGDTKVEISVDGDDLYDAQGNIVDSEGNETTTKYYEMPITRATMQRLFDTDPLPKYKRPDITGHVATSLTNVETYTFYDYDKGLAKRLNELFYELGASRKNGLLTIPRDINVPIFIRITSGGNFYVYHYVLENMEKVITNNDFNICSMSVRNYGKGE